MIQVAIVLFCLFMPIFYKFKTLNFANLILQLVKNKFIKYCFLCFVSITLMELFCQAIVLKNDLAIFKKHKSLNIDQYFYKESYTLCNFRRGLLNNTISYTICICYIRYHAQKCINSFTQLTCYNENKKPVFECFPKSFHQNNLPEYICSIDPFRRTK